MKSIRFASMLRGRMKKAPARVAAAAAALLIVLLPLTLLAPVGGHELSSLTSHAVSLILTAAAAILLYRTKDRGAVVGGLLLFLCLAVRTRVAANLLSPFTALSIFVFALSFALLAAALLQRAGWRLRLLCLAVALIAFDLHARVSGWGSWHLPLPPSLAGRFSEQSALFVLPPVTPPPGPLTPPDPSLISLLTLAGVSGLALIVLSIGSDGNVKRRAFVPGLICLVAAGAIWLTSGRGSGLPAGGAGAPFFSAAQSAAGTAPAELYAVLQTPALTRDFLQVYGFPVENTPWLAGRSRNAGWLQYTNAYAPLPAGTSLPQIAGAWRRAGYPADELDCSLLSDAECLQSIATGLRRRPANDKFLLAVTLPASLSLRPILLPSDVTQRGLYGRMGWDPLLQQALERHSREAAGIDAFLTQIFSAVEKENVPVTFFAVTGQKGADPVAGRPAASEPFNWNRARIPLFFQASAAYRQKYADAFERLTENSDIPLVSDQLPSLLLAAADAVPPEAPFAATPEQRIAASVPVAGDPLLLIRRLPHDDPLVRKLTVHRVNSLGRLAAVQQSGLRRVELDVNFQKDDDAVCGGSLEVMHRGLSRSGTDLEAFFAAPLARQVDFFWLDGKNFSQKNADNVLCLLERLDARSAVRSKMIIETYAFPPQFAAAAEDGWRFSGLPGSRDKTVRDPVAQGKAIAAAAVQQRLRDLSFRAGRYNFVKTYVEPYLPAGVRYHLQEEEALRMEAADFLFRLRSRDYAADSRVETILVDSSSYFYL